MANIGTLTAHLGMDTSDFDKSVDRTKNKIASFVNKGAKEFSAFQNAIGGASVVMGAIAATGVVAFLKSATQAAMESQVAWNDLSASVERHGGSWQTLGAEFETFAGRLQSATALSDEAIARGIQTFLDFGATGVQAMDRVRVAADLAVGAHMDLESAVSLLAKASEGNTQMLGRYGIILDESIPKAERFARAVEQINEKFGGAAVARMATTAGQIELMAQRWDDFKENLGELVLTVLDPAIRSFNEFFGILTSQPQDFSTMPITSEAIAQAMKNTAIQTNAATREIDAFLKRMEELQRLTPSKEGVMPTLEGLFDEPGKKAADSIGTVTTSLDSLDETSRRVIGGQRAVSDALSTVAGTAAQFDPTLGKASAAMNDFKGRARETTEEVKKLSKALEEFFEHWDRIIQERDFDFEEHAIKMRNFYNELSRSGEMLGPGREEMISGYTEFFQAERDALEELMSADNQTRDSMIRNAVAYRAVMVHVIEAERLQLERLNVSAETIAAITEQRMADVVAQTDAMLRDSLGGLRGWVYDLSEDLNATFRDSFFAVMKGEFDSFYDFVEAITDVFLNSIAQQMADEMTKSGGLIEKILGTQKAVDALGSGDPEAAAKHLDASLKDSSVQQVQVMGPIDVVGPLTNAQLRFQPISARVTNMCCSGKEEGPGSTAGAVGAALDLLFGGGGSSGSAAGDFNVPPEIYAAHGAIVRRPTIAMIGEAGPEAVVPLAKLHSRRFWDEMVGVRDPGGNREGDVHISFNISTPDIQSFKQSESQLMTRAAMALGRSRRNM